jgi:hypothetical protein
MTAKTKWLINDYKLRLDSPNPSPNQLQHTKIDFDYKLRFDSYNWQMTTNRGCTTLTLTLTNYNYNNSWQHKDWFWLQIGVWGLQTSWFTQVHYKSWLQNLIDLTLESSWLQWLYKLIDLMMFWPLANLNTQMIWTCPKLNSLSF